MLSSSNKREKKMTDKAWVVELFGSYNQFPPGWEKIPPSLYGKLMTMYPIEHFEYRQMLNDFLDPTTDGVLHFFNNETGVGVTSKMGIDEDGDSFIVTEFFRFGCNHEMVEIPWEAHEFGMRMRGDSAHRCIHCGFTRVTSSD